MDPQVSKIVAIVRSERLREVEEKLRDLGVPGISVTQVKGYGEYADFFKRDWFVKHVKIEIFVRSSRVNAIAAAIMEAAHTGGAGDGLVAIIPVQQLFRIRTKSEPGPDAI